MKPELNDWLLRDHPVHLSVLCATDELRREECRSVVTSSTDTVLVIALASVDSIVTLWQWSPMFEQLIRRLVQKDELIVGEELQHVLDLGLYSSTLNVLFSDLWDARFAHVEGSGAEPAIDSLLHRSFAR